MAVDAQRPQRASTRRRASGRRRRAAARSGWVAPTSSSRSAPTTSEPGDPDAAEQEAQEVDRALVGPVEVVDDEHRRVEPEVLEHGGEDLVGLAGAARASRVTSSPSWSATSWSGPERARGRQRVAGAPEHRHVVDDGVRERLQQRALAGARTRRSRRPCRRARLGPGCSGAARAARSSSRSSSLTLGIVPRRVTAATRRAPPRARDAPPASEDGERPPDAPRAPDRRECHVVRRHDPPAGTHPPTKETPP